MFSQGFKYFCVLRKYLNLDLRYSNLNNQINEQFQLSKGGKYSFLRTSAYSYTRVVHPDTWVSGPNEREFQCDHSSSRLIVHPA